MFVHSIPKLFLKFTEMVMYLLLNRGGYMFEKLIS